MFTKIGMFVSVAALAAIVGFICLVAGLIVVAQIAGFLFFAMMAFGLSMILRDRLRNKR